MKKKRLRIAKAFGLTSLACAFLLTAHGCSPAQKTSTNGQAATEAESTSAAETETQQFPEAGTGLQVHPQTASDPDAGVGFGVGFDKQQIQHVDGIDVLSGRVERVGGSMIYTPAPGDGFFTINGTIADNSEIAISIHPVGVLRYKLSLKAETERTVKAEIRVYKNNELLVSCEQAEMRLQEGANDVDVCIDTGEGHPCDGTYDLRFYLDDCLVSANEYEA